MNIFFHYIKMVKSFLYTTNLKEDDSLSPPLFVGHLVHLTVPHMSLKDVFRISPMLLFRRYQLTVANGAIKIFPTEVLTFLRQFFLPKIRQI